MKPSFPPLMRRFASAWRASRKRRAYSCPGVFVSSTPAAFFFLISVFLSFGVFGEPGSGGAPDPSSPVPPNDDPLRRRILEFEKRVETLTEMHDDRGHPEVVRVRQGLALSYEEAGRFDAAIKTIRENLPFLERVWRQDHLSRHAPYREALFVLGGALLYQDRLKEAEAALERGEQAWKKVRTMIEPAPVPLCLILKGVLFDLSGRGEDASSVYRECAAALPGTPSPMTGYVLPQLRRVASRLESMDRFAGALTLRQRALSILEKHYHRFHPEIIHTLKRLADLYAKTGRSALEKKTRDRLDRILSENNRIGRKPGS
jgi:tetratricopeptide (TPR) repeat protein